MKKLTIKETQQINGGDTWKNFGEAVGKFLNHVSVSINLKK